MAVQDKGEEGSDNLGKQCVYGDFAGYCLVYLPRFDLPEHGDSLEDQIRILLKDI